MALIYKNVGRLVDLLFTSGISSKAKMRLNWHPCWHLEETLDKIVTWHKAYRENNNMRKVTLKQIADYQMNKGDLQCKL